MTKDIAEKFLDSVYRRIVDIDQATHRLGKHLDAGYLDAETEASVKQTIALLETYRNKHERNGSRCYGYLLGERPEQESQ